MEILEMGGKFISIVEAFELKSRETISVRNLSTRPRFGGNKMEKIEFD